MKKGLIDDEVEYIESLKEQGGYPLLNFTKMSKETLIREKQRWMDEAMDFRKAAMI